MDGNVKSKKQLIEEHDHLRAILNMLKPGIMTINENGLVTFLNSMADVILWK